MMKEPTGWIEPIDWKARAEAAEADVEYIRARVSKWQTRAEDLTEQYKTAIDEAKMLKARAEAAEKERDEGAEIIRHHIFEKGGWKDRAETAEKRIKELEGQRVEGWKLRHKTVERPPLVIGGDDALEVKP